MHLMGGDDGFGYDSVLGNLMETRSLSWPGHFNCFSMGSLLVLLLQAARRCRV